MSPFVGTWDIQIATPVGKIDVTLIVEEDDGDLRGTASTPAETVPLQAVVADGPTMRWSQRVTRPLRLNLDFEASVDGDDLSGTARAGRLPRSKLIGRRTHGSPDISDDVPQRSPEQPPPWLSN